MEVSSDDQLRPTQPPLTPLAVRPHSVPPPTHPPYYTLAAKHLASWHAKSGALTLTLILLQIAFGAVVVYAPLQRLVGGEARAKAMWKFHRISGYTTLLLLFVTPALAIGWSDWVVGHSSRTERVAMLAGLGLSLVGVVARVRVGKLGVKVGRTQ